MTRTHLLGIVAISLPSAIGCTKTTRHHVAVFEPASSVLLANAKREELAPATATYVVRYRLQEQDDFERIDGTTIHVPRGTTLGFERTGDVVFAMAGPIRYELDVPADATLKWWSREKRPTRFAKSMKRIGEQTGDLAGKAAIGIGVGAMLAAPVAIEILDDSDDCDRRTQERR